MDLDLYRSLLIMVCKFIGFCKVISKSGFGRLVGVWNLPSQREDVKKKVRRVADSFAKQIEEAMKDDLQRSIDAVRAEVETLTAPYLNAAEEKLRRVEILQEELEKLDSELKRLRQSVQNIGM